MVLPILRPTVSGVVSDLGSGGFVRVEPKLWRADWKNTKLDDLSQYVISGRVSSDPFRDTCWILDLTMTLDGWETLQPFFDWLRPELSVFMPDGTVRHNQLGLFLVLDSGESRHEYGGTVKIDARSPTWLLGAQGFTTKFRCPPGSNRMARLRAILDEAVLTGGDDAAHTPQRYNIPTHPKTFNRAREWPRSMDRLDVANEIATGTGFYPLMDDNTGEIFTRRRGTERLLDRDPVRVWTAHVPLNAPAGTDPAIVAARGFPSEIIGAIDTSPGSADQINEIIIVNDDPRSLRYYRKKRAKNKKNKRGKLVGKSGSGRGGNKTRKIHHPLIDDDATADEVAQGLLDELSTRNTTLTLTVLPDPTFVAIRENILLGVWDQDGNVIANGLYHVHRVDYGLTPEQAPMRIDVGAVEDIDDTGT